MKNKLIKALSLLLIVLMVLSASPAALFDGIFLFGASASESGMCGENLIWTLDDEGTLTISGIGEMEDYDYWDYINAPWYSDREFIKKVVIESGVTSIGRDAFYGCTSLASVTIGNGVTTIGISAFAGCTGLANAIIGNGVTTIGESAFNGTAIYNNKANWEDNVLYIGKHLIKAKSDISGDYTIKSGTLTIANYAFEYCSSLVSVTIPDGLTTIGDYAFPYCRSLASVTIGNSVTTIGDYAFYDCGSLESVTIGDSVTTIGNSAFRDCISLASVTIPDSVTTIGGSAFEDCDNLASVTIGNGVTTIGERAFSYCGSLASVTIPDSVTTIGDEAFSSCGSLTSVTIGNGVTSIGEDAFSYCSSLASVTIPDSVTTIGKNAFYGTAIYKNEANWEDNVLYIGKHLIKAKSDIYGDYTIKSGTLIIAGSAFYGCSSLASVTIG
ncbi:MAG: leucine-rich repeat domain-containing protein, partial [Clostridia bacterium]|nr:leucine-rich repeat domain-containing protein [Clostridia bacterium]